ncbi:MAG TPA: hypothetical protein VH599_02410 [Ktedonobacterales bacterium]|jgi:hypothetical protein
MSRRKVLLWGVVILLLVALVSSIFLRSFSPSGTAVDTTGTSAATPSAPGQIPTSTPIVPTGGPAGGNNTPFILFTPGVVHQGSVINVLGSEFDPKVFIDFRIKQKANDPGKVINSIQTDATGSFSNVAITLPASQPFGNFIIQAHQRNSDKIAQSMGFIQNGSIATVKLSSLVGKVGDTLKVTAKGFAPHEKVNVYWDSMSTDPIATLTTDEGGGIGQAPLQVPFGAEGNNYFIFMGVKSQTPVTNTFFMLKLYPTVKLSSYSIRADNVLSYSGKGFGPNETVLVFVNRAVGQPLAIVQTNAQGTFANAPGFLIPFGLKGKQTLLFMGSQSRAPASVAFTVAPYNPVVQPSTYGGSPGTTISFYAKGFARNEVVHVYTGNPEKMISCFQVDGHGNVGAAGSYTIPSNVQKGKLAFTLTGSKSGGTAVATITVAPADTPVEVQPQPPFTCPLDGK